MQPQLPHIPEGIGHYLRDESTEMELRRIKNDHDRERKYYEGEIAMLQRQLNKSERKGGGAQLVVEQSAKLTEYEANIQQLKDEKSALMIEAEELKQKLAVRGPEGNKACEEKDIEKELAEALTKNTKLSIKIEEMELRGNVEASEVRKEMKHKEREARKALDKLQEALNEAETEKAEQLELRNETIGDLKKKLKEKEESIATAQATVADLKEQLAQKGGGLTTAQATVADLKEQLAQKGEGLTTAQATVAVLKEQLAQKGVVPENKALEEFKEEHQRVLKEQKERYKEKKKFLKDEVKRLETLRQVSNKVAYTHVACGSSVMCVDFCTWYFSSTE